MAIVCPKCKANVSDGSKFCINCGASIPPMPQPAMQPAPAQPIEPTSQPLPPTEPTPQPVPQAEPQPPVQTPPPITPPTQTYTPTQPKKSNMKLIGVLLAVIIAVVIILVVVFVVIKPFGGGSIDPRYVGTWEWEPYAGFSLVYKFNSDGSLEGGTSDITGKIGTWSASGNQLCMNMESENICYTASLSSDGSELTLSSQGVPVMVLTKT